MSPLLMWIQGCSLNGIECRVIVYNYTGLSAMILRAQIY